MTSPDDRKYAKEHEWIKVSGGIGTVGVSMHAQKMLNDVVFVELPKLGQKAEAGKPICTIESVKSVSDVYAPVTGVITEVNTELESHPELINQDNYGKGWIAKIRLSDEKELGALMDAQQYDALVKDK